MVLLGAAADPGDVDLGLQDFRQGQPAEALGHWRQAASVGDPRGALYIGVLYDTGRGVPQNYQDAMTWYRRAAALGSAAGAFNLAVFYDTGLGVTKDPAAAAGWYRDAATRGFGRAAYNLGMMYESGTGVARNRARAMAYYRQAARQGIGAARDHLALLGQPFTGRSGKPDDAATQDFQQAEQVLLNRGPAEAARMTDLLRRSASRHNALAEYDLGYCYAHGLGATQDRSQALDWYRRALHDATDDAVRSIAKAGIDSLETARDARPATEDAGSAGQADDHSRLNGVTTPGAVRGR